MLKVFANQGLAQMVPPTQAQEAGHFSDTTASAAGSDDEGSTAATDGSTLRTSPAEQVIIKSHSLFWISNTVNYNQDKYLLCCILLSRFSCKWKVL